MFVLWRKKENDLKLRTFIAVMGAIFLLSSGAVLSQRGVFNPEDAFNAAEIIPPLDPVGLEQWDPTPPSMFFTPPQVLEIEEAAIGVAPVIGANTNGTGPQAVQSGRIELAGVLYFGDENWTVWINGKRVTPTHLLPEIIDIQVERNKVLLKWEDRVKNEIFSITLRPHQTYDIETGILLPG